MHEKRILVPVVGMLLMIVLPVVVALRGQTTAPLSREVQDIKATFPKVDYSYEPASDPARRAKGRNYESLKMLKTIDPNITKDGQVISNVDWELGVTALPVDKSTVVVLGTVVESKAFLSDNKDGVYSEFKIKIEEVFKNETDVELKKGNYIFAERDGGIVRFPSGFEMWVYIRSHRMPTTGNRYLFFLNRDFPLSGISVSDLNLLTAYELKGEIVTPLDTPGGETSPFLIFSGKKPQVLFEKLKEELRGSSRALFKGPGRARRTTWKMGLGRLQVPTDSQASGFYANLIL